MIKKVIYIFITAAVILGVTACGNEKIEAEAPLPQNETPAETEVPHASISNDYEYENKENEITILKYIGSDTAVQIPAEIDGSPVTVIGENVFRNCTKIINIEVPDSVVKIGNEAFYSCTKLVSIKIPDSVVSIGEKAFYQCGSLADLSIPDSVENIGKDAFSGCENLVIIFKGETYEAVGIMDNNVIFYDAPEEFYITVNNN